MKINNLIEKTGELSPSYKYLKSFENIYFFYKKNTDFDKQIVLMIKKNQEVLDKEFIKMMQKKREVKGFRIKVHHLILLWSLVFIMLLISNSYALKIIVFSLFLHETAHFTTSLMFQCSNIRFGFKIKYFIIPMVYIQNLDIYTINRTKRIIYFSSGAITNLMLSMFSLMLLLNSFNKIILFAVKINFLLFVINLIPFLFTDGYNIFVEIFEKYNLRTKILNNFFKPYHLKSKFEICYYCFVITGFVYLIIQTVKLFIYFGKEVL